MASRIRKISFLNFKYIDKDLSFWNKKFKKKIYCYCSNKYKNCKVIIKDKLVYNMIIK